MFLAIDIGNSNIVLGIYDNNVWQLMFRIPTHLEAKERLIYWTDFKNEINGTITKATLSSVVPALTDTIFEEAKEQLGVNPLKVMPSIYDNLDITILKKEEIGTDLVANAVAGFDRFGGHPTIIADFGTALTFTTISADGTIIGVAIAPGLKTAMYSLFQNAAQLPEVPLEVPTSALGKNTFHALQAGVLLGYVGLVKEIIERIDKELETTCKVIATGGLSFLLSKEIERFDEVDVNLTLNGMRLIYEQACDLLPIT